MTTTAFLLILASVALHVGWNFLCKVNKEPSLSFYCVANFIAGVVLFPLLLLARIDWLALGGHFWVYLFFSCFFELIYAIGLFKGYGRNDISLVYPIARALPTLLIPAVTLIFGIGKTPTTLALAGMAIVAVGCIIMPQKKLTDVSWKLLVSPGMTPILVAAIGTTGYTIMDNLATENVLSVTDSSKVLSLGAYLCVVQFGIALFILLYMLAFRLEGWRVLKANFKQPAPYLVGVFSFMAYFLVLGAMSFVTNVSYLQAFRQMSLPLGVLAGVYFLKERFTLSKAIGTAMVVFGLVLTVV